MMDAFDLSQNARSPLLLRQRVCKVAFQYTNPNYDD